MTRPRFRRPLLQPSRLAFSIAAAILLTSSGAILFIRPLGPELLTLSIALLVGAVALVLAASFARTPDDRHRIVSAHGLICMQCRYDLSGTPGATTCTECGRPFDPQRARLYWVAKYDLYPGELDAPPPAPPTT